MSEKISINKDISRANTLPSSFYLEKEYFKLTIEKIFKISWQFITDTSNLNNKKQIPFNILEDSLNESILLIKDKDVTALSNVCTHRGSILCNSYNNSQLIQCPYHGRTFDLDGTLKNAPGFKKTKDFPSQEDNLVNIPIQQFKSLVFASIKPKINLDDVFKDIDSRLGWYPFDKLSFDLKTSNTYKLKAHWALYCENYLEGFHIPFIHHGLATEVDLSNYKYVLLENGFLQYAISKDINDSLKITEGYADYRKNIYAYYYWIFPNIMLNFYSWGLSVNIIEPINPKLTRVRFLSFPISEKKQPENSSASLDRVEKEDQDIILKVQKGIHSNFYKKGRYSAEHEKGVHHFHRLLCKHLN